MSSVAKGEEVQMIAEKQEEKPAVAEEKTTANVSVNRKTKIAYTPTTSLSRLLHNPNRASAL